MKTKKYFGLRGNASDVAIVAIAGIDFLLLGYDQVSEEFKSYSAYMADICHCIVDCPPRV